jgi:hypothetical protein
VADPLSHAAYLWRYVILPFVRSYGESSNETLSPFMILIRLRRSLPAIVASTFGPDSSSIENIPALNFSTTLPNTSIESSFGKCSSFPFGLNCESRQDRTRAVTPDYRKMPNDLSPAAAARPFRTTFECVPVKQA